MNKPDWIEFSLSHFSVSSFLLLLLSGLDFILSSCGIGPHNLKYLQDTLEVGNFVDDILIIRYAEGEHLEAFKSLQADVSL